MCVFLRAGCGAGDHRWGDLHWGGGGDLDKDQPHGSLDWTAKLGDWSVQQWWTTDVFLGSAFDQIIIWVNIFFLDQLNYGVRLLAENHFNHFTNLGTKFNWINIGRELRSLNWNVYSGWNCIKWQSVCHLPFFLSSIKPQMDIVDKPARLTIRVLWFLFLIVRRVPRPSESGCKKCNGLKKYLLGHTFSWKRLSAILCPWNPPWWWFFSLKLNKKCLKTPLQIKGLSFISSNLGNMDFFLIFNCISH